MSDQRVRVMSMDNHPLLREGIAAVVNSQLRDMVHGGAGRDGKCRDPGSFVSTFPTSR